MAQSSHRRDRIPEDSARFWRRGHSRRRGADREPIHTITVGVYARLSGRRSDVFPVLLRKDGDLTLSSLNAPNFGIRYRFCRLWTRPLEAQARMGLDSQPFSWSARTGRLYSWSATYGRFRMGKSSRQIRRRSACTDSLWAQGRPACHERRSHSITADDTILVQQSHVYDNG